MCGFSGPPGSGAPDFRVISIETEDAANTMKEFATSNHPWAIKFREYAKKHLYRFHGCFRLHSMK